MIAARNILCIFFLTLAVQLAAQELPTLGKASEITTGELPNGISYYIVSNKSLPGFADFAIVQPSRTSRTSPRGDLAGLPHFDGRKPWRFLAESGIRYGERGYIQNLRDATVMRFSGVPVFQTAVYDSTLLMLMDITRNSEYRQAIIVSGDVDATAVRERLRLMSMTVSARTPDPDARPYSWRSQDSAAVTTSTGPIASIRVMYRSPRTERELMNTIQPLMSRMLAEEFGIIYRRRIHASFRQNGIPLAGCGFRYTGSDRTSGDEMFTLTVETAPETLDAAVQTMAGVLSSLNGDGATEEEVSFARSVRGEAFARDDDNIRPANADYVDKCISSYLYGSGLASEASLGAFLSGRRIDLGRERELLNRYISAAVTYRRNIHIHARSNVRPQADSIYRTFVKGWQEGCKVVPDTPVQADTSLLRTSGRKVKLRTTTKESFSGCKMWTFSNGVSVYFKQTADKGAFHYGYMVKGGWTEIQDVNAVEAACASDVLALEKVGSMDGEYWNGLLEMNGITLKPEITVSDLRYTGVAPSERLTLVLKAMVSMATGSSADREAFDRYCREKSLRFRRDRFSAAGTRAILDSTMCPGYKYAAGSIPGTPRSDFADRVHAYHARKGADTHNTVLVLMGDLDENSTLKYLTQILGAYPNGQQRVVRPRMDYPLRACWSTSNATGGWRDRGVTVSMSARWPFSAEGNMSLRMACAALEQELSASLAPMGYRFSVIGEADLLPAEKATIYINCYPVPAGGLPAGISPGSPADALNAVRATVNRMGTEDVRPEVMERAKAAVLGSMKASAENTASTRDDLLYLNALGRDIGNDFEPLVKASTAASIREVFAAMDACKAEFVVR
ncbi:MAG: hypothetical protein J5737_04705 [Bacteroidales bacterium]|nr:hypothetical protein [Bacteroidales bacterium]